VVRPGWGSSAAAAVACAAVGALAALTTGCSVGAFDDRRNQAWSDSNGAPDGVDSVDFGVAVSSVDTGRPGVHIVAAGNGPVSLSTLSYDGDGDFSQTGLALAEIAPAAANLDRPPTVVGAHEDIVGGDGVVAIGGLGDLGQILLYDARTGGLGPTPRRVLECGVPIPDLGRHMAFAQTDLGSLSAPDLVATGADQIVVFVDVSPIGAEPTCYRCPLRQRTPAIHLRLRLPGKRRGGLPARHRSAQRRAGRLAAVLCARTRARARARQSRRQQSRGRQGHRHGSR
jgi:hypothetical protein